MKRFAKEAWIAFWYFGLVGLSFAAAMIVMIHRCIGSEDAPIVRTIILAVIGSFIMYRNVRDWKKARAARLKKAQNAGEVQE